VLGSQDANDLEVEVCRFAQRGVDDPEMGEVAMSRWAANQASTTTQYNRLDLGGRRRCGITRGWAARRRSGRTDRDPSQWPVTGIGSVTGKSMVTHCGGGAQPMAQCGNLARPPGSRLRGAKRIQHGQWLPPDRLGAQSSRPRGSGWVGLHCFSPFAALSPAGGWASAASAMAGADRSEQRSAKQVNLLQEDLSSGKATRQPATTLAELLFWHFKRMRATRCWSEWRISSHRWPLRLMLAELRRDQNEPQGERARGTPAAQHQARPGSKPCN